MGIARVGEAGKIEQDEGELECAPARRLDGEPLAERPRGSGGFGYDPAFVPDATGPEDRRTYSELTQAEKNEISHRGRAARMLVRHLEASAGEAAPAA